MVFETKDQIIKRKKMARYKFKAIARKAMLNAFWLAELDDVDVGESVPKNVEILLRRPKEKRGVLTLQDKALLKKPSAERTSDEIKHLEKLLDDFPGFKEFSPIIRTQLIGVVEFQYFEKDRLLFKENHMSLSMYFVLTGEVLITQIDTSDNQNKPVNILSSGSCFGHLGLIHDSNRNASASTQTNCELLCVYKEDFDAILRKEMTKRHENIKLAIQRFGYFKNFTEEKITEACLISKIEEFSPQEIIFSQTDISNFSYFVLSGKCMILHCLKIRDKGKGKTELVETKQDLGNNDLTILKFPTRQSALASMIDTNSSDIKHQFIDVGSLTVGGVFGIGEEMINRIIIARNVVQCLLIPRHWLFQKAQNIGNVWQRIKLFLNSSVPSERQLYESYLSNQKWKKYKKKTMDEIKRELGLTAARTQYYNIPIICRIEEN